VHQGAEILALTVVGMKNIILAKIGALVPPILARRFTVLGTAK